MSMKSLQGHPLVSIMQWSVCVNFFPYSLPSKSSETYLYLCGLRFRNSATWGFQICVLLDYTLWTKDSWCCSI